MEIGSRDLGHAHVWVVLWSILRAVKSFISVPNLKRILFVRDIRGSQNFKIGSRDLGHIHSGAIRGRFMIRMHGMQEGSVLHHCTKFEVDSLIRSKVEDPKIWKLGHMTPAMLI